MPMIEIALIDDHQLFAEGLRHMFADIHRFNLSTYPDENVLTNKAIAEWPQVLLLDINLEGASGLELCRDFKARNPEMKIIALTMVNEMSMIRAMINAGADGYLLKNTRKEELVHAIDAVLNGEIYLGENTRKVVKNPVKLIEQKQRRYSITKRETDVLRLLVEEFTTQEIADQLGIAFTTVETHRKNLSTKLGVKNVAGLVRIAIEEKLI